MKNVILFADEAQIGLQPLTFTKPVGELRMGILTFRERWQKLLETDCSYLTEEYLKEAYPLKSESENLYLNASFLPTNELVETVNKLELGSAILQEGKLVAFYGAPENFSAQKFDKKIGFQSLIYIHRPFHLFQHNHVALAFDFELITKNRKSEPLPEGNQAVNSENIFIEKGAKIQFSILNASEGPIYIGENAEIMEGSLVRGGLALCQGAKLNMGAKVYGTTTIGPYCKVGGEVNNVILSGYSNKGHEGFLGNAVLGEWCNLGADTNNSNLKNNYGEVKLWNYGTQKFEPTGLQFCGLMMGDHAKAAINTQFNTGTVVGPFANVFCAGFPPNKINAFSWGGKNHDPKFKLEAAYEVAQRMMERRKKQLTPEMKNIIYYLFNNLDL